MYLNKQAAWFFIPGSLAFFLLVFGDYITIILGYNEVTGPCSIKRRTIFRIESCHQLVTTP